MNPTILPQPKGCNSNNLLQLKEHDDLPKKKGCNMKQNHEMGRIPSLSSSCVTRRSIGQQCRLSQSGRSMVEILGVISIIGVLSIGGIMGYTYGMNKYRTNETIHEINLRLMTLQTQTMSGNELNLNEFTPVTGLGYTVGDNYGWAEDDTKIYIGFSGIPEQVCEMVYEEMITKVDRIDVTTSQESTSLCGQDNEMKFYIDSGVEAVCEPSCGAGEYCMAGIKCVKPWERTTTTCEELGIVGECEKCSGIGWQSTPIPLHGVECNDGNGICSNGICVPKEEVTTCSQKNPSCPDGQYCARERHTNTCNPPVIGCVPIAFSPVTITLSSGKVETWYRSNKQITWHDAMFACDAMGKKMLSKKEFESMPEYKQKLREAWSSTDTNNCTAYTTISHAPYQGKSYSQLYAYCR